MADKNSISLSTAVSNSTFKTIQQLAIEEDIATGLALDLIVEEWAGMNSVREQSTVVSGSYVERLARNIELIDNLVDKAIAKLKRASL